MTGPEVAIGAQVLGTAFGVAGAIQQGNAAQAQANFQAQVARNNQIIAGRAAEDARRRGEIEAAQQGRKSAILQGRQRAALAGAGVTVGQDSALDLVADTAALGTLDALTIQSNAEREALGFEAQAANFQADAELARLSGQNAKTGSFLKAGSSLLTGVGSVATKWSAFKKESPNQPIFGF